MDEGMNSRYTKAVNEERPPPADLRLENSSVMGKTQKQILARSDCNSRNLAQLSG
jgi:hypothetical protein